MPKIKKQTLKEIIRLYRKYWKTGDRDILSAKIERCKELSKQAFEKDYEWSSMDNIVCGITLLHCNRNMNITYETIYKIFELLGFEIVEDNETEEIDNAEN